MSNAKEVQSKLNSDRIKLSNHIIGQFEENNDLRIFCMKHKNQLIVKICNNEKCEQQVQLFCVECVFEETEHIQKCKKFILPLEIGIQQIAKRFQVICPENS